MPAIEDVKVAVLLSAWSSGSTSVSGYLDRCGAYTCPPHVRTNDERTPIAYEPIEFRKALIRYVDEKTLTITGQLSEFEAFLQDWLPRQKENALAAGSTLIAIKHPLAVAVVSALHEASQCRFALITRNYDAIEKTRERRNWFPRYGKNGAQAIYNTALHQLINLGLPFASFPYELFRTDPKLRQSLLDYVGLKPDAAKLTEADAWLR